MSPICKIDGKNVNILKDSNIVIFGGGSAARGITLTLIRLGANVTRIVSSIDDGGNSGVLREAFGMIPIGDIRNALASMAEASDCPKSFVEFLNLRLSTQATNKETLEDVKRSILNENNLIKQIPPEIQELVRDYLMNFVDRFSVIEDNHKYRLIDTSLGNLFLAGAYFRNSENINTAITKIQDVCRIKGSVWPAMLVGGISLGAIFNDGSILLGESNITNLDRDKDKRNIEKIFLTGKVNGEFKPINARANPATIEAIRGADVLLYGPGSFFTSILPHMLVNEIVKTIANCNTPKILIGNILEDNETYNLSLEYISRKFLELALENCNSLRKSNNFLTYIMANEPVCGTLSCAETRSYLRSGDLASLYRRGISIIAKDYEDPSKRGNHSPSVVALDISNILKAHKI